MQGKKELIKNLLIKNIHLFRCPICESQLCLQENSLMCEHHHLFDISKKGVVLLHKKYQKKIDEIYTKNLFINRRLFINEEFYLVDAPGYGYATLSKREQKKFGLMMEDYLINRKNLKHVFMLIDFRNKPSNDDLQMYKFLKYYKVPVTIVATKVDKVSITHQQKQRSVILNNLDLVVGDDFFMFSNVTKQGRDEVYEKIERMIS